MTTFLFILLIYALCCTTGCSQTEGLGNNKRNSNIYSINNYKDIPGVTSADITAIEELKALYGKFSYGQMLETEAFILSDGTKAGFAVEFCKLLSGLFETEFVFEFHDWESLINGLNNREIDFTGDLTPTEERMRSYYMTYPIAERTQRIFVLSENYSHFRTEKDADGSTIGYLQGSIDAEQIRKYYSELSIDFIGFNDFDSAARMLETGIIDAFATEGVLDPVFDQYEFIRSKEFFPLAYSPVSMTTANPNLAPFITVMNKYISAGGIDVLFDLYKKGNDEYSAFKLSKSFTEEERAYLDNLKAKGETVKTGMEADNYPVSFYDKTKKQFDGIAHDVLAEVERLTGIVFENVSSKNSPWSELFEMLKAGEISLVSELLYSQEREGLFRWSDIPYTSSNYVLISLYGYPNLLNYQVVRTKVGALEGTGYADKYREWFPANDNLYYYKTAGDVFKALEKGEIDLIIGSDHMLLMQQNFYQNPKFKINIRFFTPMDSHFGLNLQEEVLCSIICKSMDYINTDRIAQSWTSRGYNYVLRMSRLRMIYFCIIAVITALLLIRTMLFNRNLNKLVKERTHKLEMQTIAAQAASNAKSTFLANMSHEIRTPMNAILGITEILLQDESIPANAEEALGQIYDSSDILMSIINDILDLSKIEAGKLELVLGKYDMPSLINDTMQLNRMRYESKPIKFSLKLDENLPLTLFGDELRIKQILNNILSNAYKYTEKGTIEMAVFCESKNDADGAHSGAHGGDVNLFFRISDTGQGMTEEQIDLLFNEYMRFNLDINRSIPGTGLGMSITKHLVDIMNGEIIVKSDPGKGSVFTIRLPQKRIGEQVCGKETTEKLQNFRYQSASISKNSQIYREYMPHGSILIVDDVKSNIYVTRGMLLPYGLRADAAYSGFEAIEKIKEGTVYDLIFMDHMMPKMDGIETVKIIRDMGYDKPIVALTANALVGQAEMFLKNGFDGYISKPIDSRELNQVLNEFVRNKKNLESFALAEEADLSAAAKRRTAENPELKRFFILDAENAIAGLEGLLNKFSEGGFTNDETESFEIIVHGMKSALANIGETELSGFALKLEKAAKEKNLEAMVKDAPAFIDALRALLNKPHAAGDFFGIAVGGAVGGADGGEINKEDAAFLMEKLKEIKTACEKYEINTAKTSLNELKQKTWTAEIADLIDEINVHLLHSAFKKAVKSIELFENIYSNK